jgi:prepilin-type N-terminal cleavage/methylation domain-containing protein
MMNLHSHIKVRRRAAFTLMELLVVISIIALLAAMTMGTFTYAQKAAMRNRTTATHRAIISGLENYNSEFGEFPEPASSGGMETFNGKSYNTGSAKMLYQALSGDGSDMIKIASGGATASDGKWEGTEKMLLTDMPKEMYTYHGKNIYTLLDGFSHPFQYTKGGTADAVNPTYDLWSYGEDEDNTKAADKASKQDFKKSAKWIKNF